MRIEIGRGSEPSALLTTRMFAFAGKTRPLTPCPPYVRQSPRTLLPQLPNKLRLPLEKKPHFFTDYFVAPSCRHVIDYGVISLYIIIIIINIVGATVHTISVRPPWGGGRTLDRCDMKPHHSPRTMGGGRLGRE